MGSSNARTVLAVVAMAVCAAILARAQEHQCPALGDKLAVERVLGGDVVVATSSAAYAQDLLPAPSRAKCFVGAHAAEAVGTADGCALAPGIFVVQSIASQFLPSHKVGHVVSAVCQEAGDGLRRWRLASGAAPGGEMVGDSVGPFAVRPPLRLGAVGSPLLTCYVIRRFFYTVACRDCFCGVSGRGRVRLPWGDGAVRCLFVLKALFRTHPISTSILR